MRDLHLGFGCALTAAVLWNAGCGGKVVLESGQGGYGQGGAPGVTTNATGTSSMSGLSVTGPSVTSTGTGGDVKEACAIACDALIAQGCSEGNCFETCVQDSIEGPCAAKFATWVECIAQHTDEITECSAPAVCSQQQNDYLQCDGGSPCDPQSCEGDANGNCSCSVACGGTKFQSECKETGNGSFCLCNVNGNPIGKCENGPNLDPCDIFGNCCAGILFGDGDGAP